MSTTDTDLGLPFAHCPHCAKDVLLYTTLGLAEEFVTHCLSCDTVLQTDATLGTWTAHQSEAAGYKIEDITPGPGCGCSNAPPR